MIIIQVLDYGCYTKCLSAQPFDSPRTVCPLPTDHRLFFFSSSDQSADTICRLPDSPPYFNFDFFFFFFCFFFFFFDYSFTRLPMTVSSFNLNFL